MEALKWIAGMLNKHRVPFQVSGGLAAKIYGSPRELNDIDIDIYEEHFAKILEEVKAYVTFGPARYKDGKWDLMLMTLDYKGQLIDISGIRTAKISTKDRSQWLPLGKDFSKVKIISYEGIELPIIDAQELLDYKSHLDGDHQQADINAVKRYLI